MELDIFSNYRVLFLNILVKPESLSSIHTDKFQVIFIAIEKNPSVGKKRENISIKNFITGMSRRNIDSGSISYAC